MERPFNQELVEKLAIEHAYARVTGDEDKRGVVRDQILALGREAHGYALQVWVERGFAKPFIETGRFAPDYSQEALDEFNRRFKGVIGPGAVTFDPEAAWKYFDLD